MHRRGLLRLAVGTLLARAMTGIASSSQGSSVKEQQKGDPDEQYEYVTYDPEAIAKIAVHPEGKAVFQPWKKDLPERMITTARTFIGCSRSGTPDQISEFLGLFD